MSNNALLSTGGGIGGSTGSTDNAVLRADGTGGNTAQPSLSSIDDTGNITAGTSSFVAILGTSGNTDQNFCKATFSGSHAGLSWNGSGLVGIQLNGAVVIGYNNGAFSLTSVKANNGDLICAAAGFGLQLQSGTGQRAGNATLVGGTIAVANTTVTANTLILAFVKTTGGTPGLYSYTISAGVGFTLNSASAIDTSTLTYLLLELN